MANITGTNRNDIIRVGSASPGVQPPTGATNGPDRIEARAGADTVFAGGSNDTVFGEQGNDTLNGNAGNDTLNGDAGNDTLNGNAGNDTLNGNAGNDTLNGNAGNDSVDGNQGNDVARLGAGHDLFIWDPGDGSDTVNGEAGNDTHRFNGSDGDEIFTISNDGANIELLRNLGNIDMDLRGIERIDLIAKGGNDSIDASALSNRVSLNIDGGAGNDTIIGSANADTINGGTGKDTLTGGAGADKFQFAKGDTGFRTVNADVITDFSRPQGDQIDLTATNVTDFVANKLSPAHGEVSSFFSGNDTVVRFNDGGFHDIVLDDLRLALNAHDFDLA